MSRASASVSSSRVGRFYTKKIQLYEDGDMTKTPSLYTKSHHKQWLMGNEYDLILKVCITTGNLLLGYNVPENPFDIAYEFLFKHGHTPGDSITETLVQQVATLIKSSIALPVQFNSSSCAPEELYALWLSRQNDPSVDQVAEVPGPAKISVDLHSEEDNFYLGDEVDQLYTGETITTGPKRVERETPLQDIAPGTRTSTPGPCDCGFKHFLNGKEYDFILQWGPQKHLFGFNLADDNLYNDVDDFIIKNNINPGSLDNTAIRAAIVAETTKLIDAALSRQTTSKLHTKPSAEPEFSDSGFDQYTPTVNFPTSGARWNKVTGGMEIITPTIKKPRTADPVRDAILAQMKNDRKEIHDQIDTSSKPMFPPTKTEGKVPRMINGELRYVDPKTVPSTTNQITDDDNDDDDDSDATPAPRIPAMGGPPLPGTSQPEAIMKFLLIMEHYLKICSEKGWPVVEALLSKSYPKDKVQIIKANFHEKMVKCGCQNCIEMLKTFGEISPTSKSLTSGIHSLFTMPAAETPASPTSTSHQWLGGFQLNSEQPSPQQGIPQTSTTEPTTPKTEPQSPITADMQPSPTQTPTPVPPTPISAQAPTQTQPQTSTPLSPSVEPAMPDTVAPTPPKLQQLLVDNSKGVCRIRIKLFSGRPLDAIFNLCHTVPDIRHHIDWYCQENNVSTREYSLVQGVPPKPLAETNSTLQELGLANCVVSQVAKKS
ncbi:hypothetical protein Pelo_3084 [Pelomyxa schiedti]|nr:hypothetical protein Pelo_3084 [Pelomyxa schiedti]